MPEPCCLRNGERIATFRWSSPEINGNEFVAYVDAIGYLDGNRRLLEWKTTSARYPEQPEGLISLDLQLVCYSWITGMSDVAIVAFVRKRVPEIQYLLASITDEQRREFGQLVDATVALNRISELAECPLRRSPEFGSIWVLVASGKLSSSLIF